MMSPTNAEIADTILHQRLSEPNLPFSLAKSRERRSDFATAKLVILAMDHPARGVMAAGGNSFAMANRVDLLRRIAEMMSRPGVDGLLATPDVMEDLFVLNAFLKTRGQADFLHRKVLVGSINRGGLAGTAFELDDFVSAYTPNRIANMNLDAGKLLLRVDPTSYDSAKTVRYCVEVLEALDNLHLPCFLEPLAVPQSTDALVSLVGVASGLASTSRNRWLKLPMVDEFERVANATTCPILLLGGGNPGSTNQLIDSVQKCLKAGANVRGLMMGRGVLYPADGASPADVADRLATVVHEAH
ncbi:hypothetical protein JZ785_21245 [Alicyclobacillus curvatus]|nr:hypothetical protein JZ785_21245 [Alicyclobacillus curvatus]